MYSAIDGNKRKTVLLFVLFFVFVAGLATLLSLYQKNLSYLISAIVFGAGYGLWSYFGAAKLALMLNGAHEVSKADEPQLYRVVENLVITDGLPMPKVYVIEDPAPNAFATGRDPKHAVVAVTRGLLDMMDKTELEGVVAHELGHVKNLDILVSMVAFALVSVVTMLCDFFFRISRFGGNRRRGDNSEAGMILGILSLVAIVLAPLAATLIQLAISRRREYLADATGAMTTRYPEGLARALEKIQQYGSALQRQNTSTAHLFFANPLRGRGASSWFSTHPPIEDRIQRLKQMDSQA